jgi:hypothetical protein
MALKARNCYNPAGIAFVMADVSDEAGTITTITRGDEGIKVCKSIQEVELAWHQWTTRGRCMLGSFDFLSDEERDFLTYGTFKTPKTTRALDEPPPLPVAPPIIEKPAPALYVPTMANYRPMAMEAAMIMGAIAGQARS